MLSVLLIAIIPLMAISPQASADVEPIAVNFQDGLDGYTGTIDTFIMESNAATDRGDENWVEWDNDDPYGKGTSNFGLIRFENIFGSGVNQIPPDATIVTATLTYTVSDTGDPADVNEVAVDWTEGVTYDGFGGESGHQCSIPHR